MSQDKRKRGLGRGLSALLGDTPLAAEAPADVKGTIQVAVAQMVSGRYQPRTEFDQEALQDLADSIRAKGILQPILVRPLPEDTDRYEIIAGERRWRAAQLAQIHTVPVLVRDFSDREAAEVALIENLQRRDLSPLEEAEGYRRLMNDFARTQEDLAGALGKSRSHVANMIRLLALPDPVKGYLRDGRLTAGHARALLNADDPGFLAQQVVTKGLNVRQTEKLATDKGGVKARKPKPPKEKDADTLALERDLARILGLKVEVDFQGKGGRVIINYDTLDQLDDILYRLNNPSERQGSAASYGAGDYDDPDFKPATSFGRIPVADDGDGSPFDADPDAIPSYSFDDSVDSWASELTAETEAEKAELLKTPFEDEDDSSDGEEGDAAFLDLPDTEAVADTDPKADEDPATETNTSNAAQPVEGGGLVEFEEPDADDEDGEDGEDEDAFVIEDRDEDGEAVDDETVDLDESIDAWAAELTAETEAEKEELLKTPFEDEDEDTESSTADDGAEDMDEDDILSFEEPNVAAGEGDAPAGSAPQDPASVQEAEALLDASAEVWGDTLSAETEDERRALIEEMDQFQDDEDQDHDDDNDGDEDDVEALLRASADVWGEVLNEETESERAELIAPEDEDEDDQANQSADTDETKEK